MREESEKSPVEELPIPVKEQPDPLLQMSTGRVGVGGLALFAVVVVLILGVVLYGLNGNFAATPAPSAQSSAAAAGNSAAPAPAPPKNTNTGKG